MSLIDELRQESAAKEAAAKAEAAKRKQEKQEIIDKVINFLVTKASDPKFLEEAIRQNYHRGRLGLGGSRKSYLPICVKANYNDHKHIIGLKFYFGKEELKTRYYDPKPYYTGGGIIESSIIELNEAECKKLNINDNLYYMDAKKYQDETVYKILETVASKVAGLVEILGFVVGTTVITDDEATRECNVIFAW